VLSWRLLALLPTLQGEVFAPLQRYAAGGEAAAFELAGKVADIFDQYLVFRPDWIRAWEAGERLDLGDDEAWQAALWQQLAHKTPAATAYACWTNFCRLAPAASAGTHYLVRHCQPGTDVSGADQAAGRADRRLPVHPQPL
jgi:exonuclease V gamma subunit